MSLQSAMTYGALAVGAAIVGAGAASITLASSFDQAMHKIGALTDTSASQMQWYEQQILELAPQLDVAPTKLAEGLYFVISAGEKGAQAISTLKYSAMAAAAGMADFSSVADAVTSVMNAYRQSNLDAGTATDVLTKMIVNGKTTWSAMASSLGIVATTSAVAGLKVQEMGASLSALSQVAGMHASRRIGMDFMNLERSIGIDMDSIAKRAKKMGLAFDESKFATLSFIDKLRYLATITGGVGYIDMAQAKAYEATGKLTNLAAATAHANSMFKSLAGGAAAFIPAAILLSDKGATYDHILQQMTTHGQATADAFKVMRESTGQKWNMFEVTLQSLAVTIGLHLLPAVNGLLMGLINAGRGLITWLQSTSNLNTLKYALIGIGIVVAAVLTPAIIGFVIASAPVVLSIAAIVAGGILLGRIIQAVVAHFGGWNGVLKQLSPLLTFLRGVLAQAGDSLKKAFANPAIQQAFRQLQQALPQLIPLLRILGLIVGAVLLVVFELWVAAIRGLIGALPGVIQFVTGIVEVLGGLGRLITDIFTGKWKDIPAALGQILGGLKDEIVGLFRAILGQATGWLGQFLSLIPTKTKQGVTSFVTTLGTGIKNGVAGLVGLIGTGLANVGKGIAGAAGKVGGAIVGGIQAGIAAAGTAVSNVGKGIAGGAHWLYEHNTYVQFATDTIVRLFHRARAGVERILHILQAVLTRAWTTIRVYAAAAWIEIEARILQPVARIWANIQATFTKLLAWLGGIWAQVSAQIKQAWDKVIGWLGGLYAKVAKVVHDNIVKPIQDKWNEVVTFLSGAGGRLMKMIGDDITNGAHWVGDAAKSALKGLAGWLGFHSPAPNVPESASWGSNLVKMFATDMQRAVPVVTRAAQQVMRAAGLGGTATSGSPATSTLGTGTSAAYSLAGLSGSGGPVVHNHNWAGAFPNATSTEAIAAALQSVFDQRERDTYRRSRRAGMGGGLRAGVSG